ncbi:MAG TPA: hypothetical protein VE422_33225 [Terriglobia bacterium]|nr:hypothetical protein [Terriglobia bacterium]
METGSDLIRNRPPRFIEVMITALTPYDCRENVIGDLHRYYVATARYGLKAVELVTYALASQMRRAFDIGFIAEEIAILGVSFSPAPSRAALIIAVVAGLGALLLRDAYTHPSHESPEAAASAAAKDASVAAVFILVSETFLKLAAPQLQLPALTLYGGIGVSLLLLTMWRTVFRPRLSRSGSVNDSNGPHDELKRISHEAYWATTRINVMWGIASIAVIQNNRFAMPFSASYLDFFFPALTIPVFVFAYRLQWNVLDSGMFGSSILSLSGDLYRKELQRRHDSLWGQSEVAQKASGFASYRTVEVLFFVLLASPLCAALWGRFFGRVVSPEADGFRIGANLGAFVTLLVLWIHVKKANRRTAEILQQEMDALDDKTRLLT